jgi:hypothetical protein
VTPELMPPPQQYQGAGGYPPAPYGGSYEAQPGAMQRPSPELAMLGGFMERMMTRLDSMEARMAGPGAAPAQAPDQIAGVLTTLKLAKQINEMMNPAQDYDDDDDDDEPEWTPKNPQEAAIAMAIKKFDEDPDLFGEMFGKKKDAQPGQQPAQVGGPRLVRAAEQAPAAAPAAAMNPLEIIAQLKALDPIARAHLFHQISVSLDPETVAALKDIVEPGDSAAG